MLSTACMCLSCLTCGILHGVLSVFHSTWEELHREQQSIQLGTAPNSPWQPWGMSLGFAWEPATPDYDTHMYSEQRGAKSLCSGPDSLQYGCFGNTPVVEAYWLAASLVSRSCYQSLLSDPACSVLWSRSQLWYSTINSPVTEVLEKWCRWSKNTAHRKFTGGTVPHSCLHNVVLSLRLH